MIGYDKVYKLLKMSYLYLNTILNDYLEMKFFVINSIVFFKYCSYSLTLNNKAESLYLLFKDTAKSIMNYTLASVKDVVL